ncbi:MAG TPA: DMT family transporter [Azospirillaceae bacterium]|nr:DMT family transporter [Azospirillaceae bacterium]
MAILLGLTAALAWGVSGLFAREVSSALGAWRGLFTTQLFGLLVLMVPLIGAMAGPGLDADLAAAPAQAWVVAGIAALANTTATLSLYQAYRSGSLALAVPISSSYGVLTTAFAVLAGEALAMVEAVGIALAAGGLALAGVRGRNPAAGDAHLASIGWALLASAQYGFVFWSMGFFVAPHLGGLVPIVITRALAVLVLGGIGWMRGLGMGLPHGPLCRRAALVGLLDAIAFVSLTLGLGLGTDTVGVVTVLGSLYSAVGAVLAFLVLRERLAVHQWSGVAAIIAGVVALNL